MSDIFTVDLSRNNMEIIPIEQLRVDVNWLILSDNKIKNVPREINQFKNLSRLALNDNRIDEISKEIGECIGITWMDLTRNRLRDLPYEMGFLTRITGLGLSENEFETVPSCVFKLKNLKKFGFFSNKIRFISPEIRNLKNLVKLDLSNNNLERIPDDFCCLVNLTWLNLSNNKLKSLPQLINNLRKLEEFGLGMNDLEELPDMSNLKNLRILPVFKNRLISLHSSLLMLENIEKLDFSDNQITTFPYEGLHNPSLKYLNLRCNKISEISSFLVTDNVSSLTLIDISENQLQHIPFKFFKSFSQKASIRLTHNPFKLKNSFLSENPSLLNICFTKILNNNNPVNPWIEKIFKKKYVCDLCKNSFSQDKL